MTILEMIMIMIIALVFILIKRVRTSTDTRLIVMLMFQEAEEIMSVVDRNGDGVISYSEFRCMMGANPILL